MSAASASGPQGERRGAASERHAGSNPTPSPEPASAQPTAHEAERPLDTGLKPMRVVDLDAVTAIESRAYPFPWSRGNFVDSLAAGYLARVLHTAAVPGAPRNAAPPEVLGYYLAMPGVDEMHLLNITVAPEHEHRGHARRMLRHLVQACREAGAATLWLEVRESNLRARSLYERWGFAAVGLRKGYYPSAGGQREQAIVMSLAVPPQGNDDALE